MLSRSLKDRDWARAKPQPDEFASGFAWPKVVGSAEADSQPLTLE